MNISQANSYMNAISGVPGQVYTSPLGYSGLGGGIPGMGGLSGMGGMDSFSPGIGSFLSGLDSSMAGIGGMGGMSGMGSSDGIL